jgi:Toprim-like/Protein of unknown function (DUF3991)
VREGAYGSAWFAHRQDGEVTHVEVRGPDYKGSLTGGRKTLFRFATGAAPVRRLVVAEAPIDALSLAVLEDRRPDTLYVATGGGMGPGTIAALQALLGELAAIADALMVSAADANAAGDRYAQAPCRARGSRRRTVRAAAPVRWSRLERHARAREGEGCVR